VFEGDFHAQGDALISGMAGGDPRGRLGCCAALPARWRRSHRRGRENARGSETLDTPDFLAPISTENRPVREGLGGGSRRTDTMPTAMMRFHIVPDSRTQRPN